MSYALIWGGFSWPKKDEAGRTHQPVHRRSRPTRGSDEPASRITERQRQAWLRAFDRVARRAKPEKLRRGHRDPRTRELVGYSWFAHQVLDYLLGWATTTGRIFPSIKAIAESVGAGTKEVVKALCQLKSGGWITWERRIRPATTPPGEAGPQIEQDTNLYRVHLPLPAAELLAGWRQARGRKAGLSPDERERRERAAAVATQRRDMERKLGVLRDFLGAARPGDRRRIESQIADLERGVAEALRREAAINRPHDPRSATPGSADSPAERDSPEGRL